jgi:hypothetical protein
MGKLQSCQGSALNWALVALRGEAVGCFSLYPLHILGFPGEVFEFMAVLSLVHTGSQGGPGVVWNWRWRVYLDWVAGRNH